MLRLLLGPNRKYLHTPFQTVLFNCQIVTQKIVGLWTHINSQLKFELKYHLDKNSTIQSNKIIYSNAYTYYVICTGSILKYAYLFSIALV